MIQKKLVLGDHQLQHPIFPDYLNIFPPQTRHFQQDMLWSDLPVLLSDG